MKKLDINFAGVEDPTGLLHSLTKCLCAAVKNSPYQDLAEDVVASSGFAFRIWAAADLCPSAMSIWQFNKQKPWVESGGLSCEYVERLWGQDAKEEERRLSAISRIKESIDGGIAAIAWDLGDAEWGLVTGYDDGAEKLFTLKVSGAEGEIGYAELGKLEIPILSVLTVTGRNGKDGETIFRDALKIAAGHLRGGEWSDNALGLAAYPVITAFICEKMTEDTWSLEYYLGTYASLRFYAWKYLAKNDARELAELYEKSYGAWQKAFDIIKTRGAKDGETREEIAALLETAHECEARALEMMA